MRRERPPKTRRAATVIVLLLLAVGAPSALADAGGTIELPSGGKPKHGLRLTVDTRWAAGLGFRPVRLTLATASGSPSPGDRRLQVTLKLNGMGSSGQRTRGEILLPQGASSATTWLIAPCTRRWWLLGIEVREEGRLLKDLSNELLTISTNATPLSFRQGHSRALFVDGDAPGLADRDRLAQLWKRQTPRPTHRLPDPRGFANWQFPSGLQGVTSAANARRGAFNLTPTLDDRQILAELVSLPSVEILPPAELPKSWLAYGGVDLIFLSLDEADQIRQQQPRLWDAFRQWTAAGGNLVVYGLGYGYERLDELESLLELAPAARRGEPLRRWKGKRSVAELTTREVVKQPVMSSMPRRGWAEGTETVVERTIPELNLQKMAERQWQLRASRLLVPPKKATRPSGDELRKLREEFLAQTAGNPAWRPLRKLAWGHGQVIALPDENPFPGGKEFWRWLGEAIKPYDSRVARTGLGTSESDGRFYHYLIPGVGLPPVNAFRLLITLFAIAIGPVNYFVLRRWRRLHLLLLTVPVSAVLAVAGLFGFALLRDGLGTRARVQSVTSYDQRAGWASSWSRQTYYAGLAPSQGLIYPNTALVAPMYADNYRTRRAQQSGARLRVWEEDRQRLARGYLTSRATAQLLVADSRPLGKRRLVVREPTDAQASLRVVNRLGLPIRQLWIVDGRGRPYFAESVGEGAALELEPRPWSEARTALLKLAAEHQPRPPAGGSYGMIGTTGWGDGVLGRRYGEIFNPNPNAKPLPPRSYVAVAPRPPQVPLGVADAEESASLHLIVGRW